MRKLYVLNCISVALFVVCINLQIQAYHEEVSLNLIHVGYKEKRYKDFIQHFKFFHKKTDEKKYRGKSLARFPKKISIGNYHVKLV